MSLKKWSAGTLLSALAATGWAVVAVEFVVIGETFVAARAASAAGGNAAFSAVGEAFDFSDVVGDIGALSDVLFVWSGPCCDNDNDANGFVNGVVVEGVDSCCEVDGEGGATIVAGSKDVIDGRLLPA